MKTKPFNIDEAKAGAKVVNKAGNPVRLVCFDGESYYSGKHQQIIDSMARTYSADGIFNHNDWSDGSCDLLLVSEPKLRPWKASEVPMPAILRSSDGHIRWQILSVSSFGVATANATMCGQTSIARFEALLECNEHSTDGGKTWKPCGVEE